MFSKVKYFIWSFIFITNLAYAQYPGNVSSGLAVWLKANDNTNITVNGSNKVSQWTASNSGSIIFNNDSTTRYPSYSSAAINYNPAVVGDGSNYLESTSVPIGSTSDATMFAVVSSDAQKTVYVQIISSVVGTPSNVTFNSGGGFGQSTSQTQSGGGASSIAVINSGTRTCDGAGCATGNTITTYQNFVQKNTNTYGAGLNSTAPTGSQILGRNQVSGDGSTITVDYINGNVPEIIGYTSVLNSTDRQKVESYLAVKYGITLGSTSNPIDYLNSSGTVIWTGSATYQNNIAGIGQDDNSVLNQKQSTSLNSIVLTMARLGSGSGNSIPSANASNANTFSADNTFLIWGDNAGALAGNTTDLPATITKKSARTWKTQATGLGSQNIRVKFDLSTFGILTVSDYTLYRLILDSDGTFAAGATLISPVTGSNASKTVEFDVDMSVYPSYYLTIGTTNSSSAPLPLQFVSFNASQVENKVQLTWKTTAEVNCKNFEIEWSRDAINWEKVGKVDAINKATGINNYTFVDENPHSGLSYYRIKQVDFDGVFTYSSMQTVTTHKQINIIIEPNPADEYLEIANQETEEIVYSIFDINGKHVHTGNISGQSKFKIETQNFSAGLYLIDFLLKDQSYVQKFVVKH